MNIKPFINFISFHHRALGGILAIIYIFMILFILIEFPPIETVNSKDTQEQFLNIEEFAKVIKKIVTVT